MTLEEAPKGWKLKAGSDGYSLAGPALKAGVDAEHKIKVRQLPDAKEIAFKTVETYSDGEVSRWIELPTGGEEPEQPAPVLELKAAAPGAKPVGPARRRRKARRPVRPHPPPPPPRLSRMPRRLPVTRRPMRTTACPPASWSV